MSWRPLPFDETKQSALKGFVDHHSIKLPKDQKFDPKTFLMTVKQKAMEKCKTCFKGKNGTSCPNYKW